MPVCRVYFTLNFKINVQTTCTTYKTVMAFGTAHDKLLLLPVSVSAINYQLSPPFNSRRGNGTLDKFTIGECISSVGLEPVVLGIVMFNAA